MSAETPSSPQADPIEKLTAAVEKLAEAVKLLESRLGSSTNLLMTHAEVREALRCGSTKLWRLLSLGAIPKPNRIGLFSSSFSCESTSARLRATVRRRFCRCLKRPRGFSLHIARRRAGMLWLDATDR